MWHLTKDLLRAPRVSCNQYQHFTMQRKYPSRGRGRGTGCRQPSLDSEALNAPIGSSTVTYNVSCESQSTSRMTRNSRGIFTSAYSARANFHTQVPRAKSQGRGEEPPGASYYLRDLRDSFVPPRKIRNWRERNQRQHDETLDGVEDQALERLKKVRTWEHTELGLESEEQPCSYTDFKVLSYNVLSQTLLQQHRELYRGTPSLFLDWNYRKANFEREFDSYSADVVCLQEVQANHFESFFERFLGSRGYKGIYKRRTGDKPDGCAIFYKESKFILLEHKAVEYRQRNVRILDRDNVGLIALLAPRDPEADGENRLCVATTHLLYNPRRHDIKLAQLQLLFAELDHVAYKEDSSPHPYIPVVLTGDFNLEPQSSVYEFVTHGKLEYRGLTDKTLRRSFGGSRMSTELIPPELRISDQCQHSTVHMARNFSGGNGNPAGCHTFATGCLSHKLQLNSVYSNEYTEAGPLNATTHQDRWATVDYIFYSESGVPVEEESSTPSLSLLGKLRLPTSAECNQLGKMPNEASPSDHYPLLASFRWRWQ